MRQFLFLATIAVSVGLILFGIDQYRHRYVHNNADLARLLPPGDMTIVYADISQLRRADLLGLLAHIKVAPDTQYKDFIRETGFDYARDLDAIALGFEPSQTFLIGKGRFDWQKLQAFALTHNGTCAADACNLAASTPGRWVNMIHIQSDVLAVAVSATSTAADNLRPPPRRLQDQNPDAPVWARISHAMLKNPAGLPLPAQIFAISLQSAESVTLSAHLERVELKATFVNTTAADTARHQLAQLDTGGVFQINGITLLGTWPLRPDQLKSLQ